MSIRTIATAALLLAAQAQAHPLAGGGKATAQTMRAPMPQPFTREQRLLHAVRNNDRATIERALELGVDIGAHDDLGRGVVLLATINDGPLDLVRYLHNRGASIDQADRRGRTPLSFAAEKGRLPLAEWLLEAGARVDHADRQDRTPLFHAAAAGQADVLSRLAAHGADLDRRDRFGDTALMISCAKDQAESVRQLLALGADVSIRDQEGRLPGERGKKTCRSR